MAQPQQALTDEAVETANNRAIVIRSTYQGGNTAILMPLNAINNTLNGTIITVNDLNNAVNDLHNTVNDLHNAVNDLHNAVNDLHNSVNVLNNTVNRLDRRLSRIEVTMENARIVKRNQHLRSLGPGQLYSLRQKEVIGSGTALVQQIHGGVTLPPNIDINPPANVGAALANLDPFSVTGSDILCLVSFYNDTFGVTGVDNLAIRQEKLMHWLTESYF